MSPWAQRSEETSVGWEQTAEGPGEGPGRLQAWRSCRPGRSSHTAPTARSRLQRGRRTRLNGRTPARGRAATVSGAPPPQSVPAALPPLQLPEPGGARCMGSGHCPPDPGRPALGPSNRLLWQRKPAERGLGDDGDGGSLPRPRPLQPWRTCWHPERARGEAGALSAGSVLPPALKPALQTTSAGTFPGGPAPVRPCQGSVPAVGPCPARRPSQVEAAGCGEAHAVWSCLPPPPGASRSLGEPTQEPDG